MLPRRPRSPLFPYTTLFRSDVDRPVGAEDVPGRLDLRLRRRLRVDEERRRLARHLEEDHEGDERERDEEDGRDREPAGQEEQDLHQRAPCGSIASRTASASRLKASTVR